MDFSVRSCKLSWQFSTRSLRPPQTILSLGTLRPPQTNLSLFRNLSKIPDGLASGSGQNLQDVIGGLFKDILNGVYFGLSLIFRTIFCLSQSEVNQMFKIQSGDDLEQVQKHSIIGHNQTKNNIIEKSDIEHETKACFGEHILILDFNFDILYLQSARFDFSWVFQRFFSHLLLPRHSS